MLYLGHVVNFLINNISTNNGWDGGHKQHLDYKILILARYRCLYLLSRPDIKYPFIPRSCKSFLHGTVHWETLQTKAADWAETWPKIKPLIRWPGHPSSLHWPVHPSHGWGCLPRLLSLWYGKGPCWWFTVKPHQRARWKPRGITLMLPHRPEGKSSHLGS